MGLGSEAYHQQEHQPTRGGNNPCCHTFEGERSRQDNPGLSSEEAVRCSKGHFRGKDHTRLLYS
jgi:hypothetical protein